MIGKLAALVFLFFLAWLGQIIDSVTQLPFPSAFIGMLILFAALLGLKRVPVSMSAASSLMLKHMSLFFIPITLSVIVLDQALFEHIWVILITIVISTAISLVVSAWFFSKLKLDSDQDD